VVWLHVPTWKCVHPFEDGSWGRVGGPGGWVVLRDWGVRELEWRGIWKDWGWEWGDSQEVLEEQMRWVETTKATRQRDRKGRGGTGRDFKCKMQTTGCQRIDLRPLAHGTCWIEQDPWGRMCLVSKQETLIFKVVLTAPCRVLWLPLNLAQLLCCSLLLKSSLSSLKTP
jgi:hypothetical protein